MLEVKVVTRLETHDLSAADRYREADPPLTAKHHPCYLLCSQCGTLACQHPHTGPVRSYLYFVTTTPYHQHHWGRGGDRQTHGDYRFLKLVVCNIQIIIPTWPMMTNNKLGANYQPVLIMRCVLQYHGSG